MVSNNEKKISDSMWQMKVILLGCLFGRIEKKILVFVQKADLLEWWGTRVCPKATKKPSLDWCRCVTLYTLLHCCCRCWWGDACSQSFRRKAARRGERKAERKTLDCFHICGRRKLYFILLPFSLRLFQVVNLIYSFLHIPYFCSSRSLKGCLKVMT